jgi:amino acid adenylation domain-containing protein
MTARQVDSETIRRVALPVSAPQRRLWFLTQLDPGNPTFNLSAMVWLEGALQVEVLEACLGEVVARHEVLRTSFGLRDGEPVQVVWPQVAVSLPLVEATHSEVERLARQEAMEPFDLGSAPLLRARLLRLDAEVHVLLLTMHHLVADGWSLGVLTRELGVLYQAFAAGRRSPLPPLAVQYADWAHWQRRWLDGGALDAQLQYWTEQLSNAPPLVLPADHARPDTLSFRGAQHRVLLAAELTAGLQGLSRRLGATLFMTTLAAFYVVLHRYSGESDLAVGVPVAGRERPEVEGLIGFFVNTLVLRARLEPDWSFARLVEAVRELSLEAHSHSDVPFERLVERLAPQRDLHRNPLFDVMFAMQNTPMPGLALPGLQAQVAPWRQERVLLDLRLSLEETPQGLTAVFDYNADIFDAATIQRLAAHYQRILQGAVADPHITLANLELLDDRERAELASFSHTTVDFGAPVPVHRLIAQQATAHPDRPAVTCAGTTISYGQLWEQAQQWASALRANQVGPEVIVAVCAHRSVELVTAILAVLEAGGAYLPLDPDLPAGRLTTLCEDAAPAVILAQRSVAGAAPAWTETDTPVLWLEGAPPSGARSGTAPATTPGHLAYVIYTSGSTGRPKGVMVTHAAIVNRLRWAQQRYRLGADDVVLQKTPIGFDVSVWELLWPLMAGSRLVMAAPGAHRDPELMRAAIIEHGVTTMHFVPSMLGPFLEVDGLEACGSLRRVLCSGEVLPADLVHRFRARLHAELHNLYGPTEAAVDVTSWQDTGDPDLQVVPIGRPVANVGVRVADPHGQPQPVGVSGEIWLTGSQLARGYLHQPDLTAQHFTTTPDGHRAYRTGDLARWRADGQLLYLGRNDDQVKIRGFRVEPGEVETLLRAQPGVDDAVVVARPGPAGHQQLAAYLAGRPASPATLRQALAARLPEHMVPASYTTLAALPLTPNGKLDRRALPDPDHAAVPAGQDRTAPRTPTEQLLAGIWADVLGQDTIGIHDDFFQRGGDSILGIRLVTRARAHGLELSSEQVFEQPTVAAQAALAESAREHASVPATVRPDDAHAATSLAPAQHGLLYHTLAGADAGVYAPQVTVALRGEVDREALRTACDQVVARHEALRTTFALQDNGDLRRVVHAGGHAPWDEHDLRALAPHAREHRLAEIREQQRRRGFELHRLPLMRLALVRMGDDDHRLVWQFHHALLDGWSVPIIAAEVDAIYAAHRNKTAAELPPPFPYTRYLAWLGAQDHAAAAAHWKGKLTGFATPTALCLPSAGRHSDGSATTDECTHAVAPGLAARVRLLTREAGLTLNTLVQASWALLLARWSGVDDVVFGAVLSGRSGAVPGIEDAVGLFLNTVPVRVRLPGDAAVADWLHDLQSAEAVSRRYEWVPLAEIQEQSQIPATTPLFESLVVFNNQAPDASGALSALPVDGITTRSRTHFPLTLAVLPGETLELSIRFDPRRFQLASVELALRQLERVLALLAEHGEQQLADISLAGAATTAFGTRLEAREHTPVADVVAAVARREPAAVAVEQGAAQLCYGDLLASADAVAARLGAGVHGRAVAVAGRRSIGLVAAVLGVLRAGGVLVTIDPELPEPRVRQMLEDAAVVSAVTVGDVALPASWSAGHGAAVSVEPETGRLAGRRTGGPSPARVGPDDPAVGPDDPAYVFFTSGTTGTPKRVTGTHRGLAHFIEWERERFDVTPDDRCGQLTALSFDVVMRDLLLPLTAGATLCLPPASVTVDDVLGWLHDARVTVLHAVPSLARAWLAASPRASLGSLRWTLFAGEPLTAELVNRWHGLGAQRSANLYGPTETTLAKCCQVVSVPAPPGVQALGQPIPGAQVLVARDGLRQCGVGELGEILIRTPYRGAAVAGDDRFVRNPWTDDPADLFYRTGDAGRWRQDLVLEYAGRLDDQIKVRGVRVHPQEVEMRLSEHPAVSGAAVVAHGHDDETRLIAWIVAASTPSEVRPAELRAHLIECGLRAAIPAAFVPLDELPLTANGKIDRRALRAAPVPETPRANVAPRTATERGLADIWAEVLNADGIGALSDFFELGGHSLHALQVRSRIRSVLGVDLGLRVLFAAPTVAELAEAVEAARGERGAAAAPADIGRGRRVRQRVTRDSQGRLQALDPEK